MSTATLSDPAAVQLRLEQIDAELAELQNDYEDAALQWFKAKRNKEKMRADHFVKAMGGSVADRAAKADLATVHLGAAEEASYEALKAKSRVLETRASIGMSILRSQGRL